MSMDALDHYLENQRVRQQTNEIIRAVGNVAEWKQRYIDLFQKYNELREQQIHDIEQADAEFEFLTKNLREHAPDTEEFRNKINSGLNEVRAAANERANEEYQEYLKNEYRPTMNSLNLPID